MKSADFARTDGRGGGWWGWRDEKRWLEALPLPSPGEVHAAFIEQSIAALGVTLARCVHGCFRIKPRLKDADLARWLDSGRVLQVAVEGWDRPGCVHADHCRALSRAARGALLASHTSLLSPFDPVVWDRERASWHGAPQVRITRPAHAGCAAPCANTHPLQGNGTLFQYGDCRRSVQW